ncbi:MAG: hypothetical protein JXA41_07775 [Deltaproteobacteria bacterium]|nr:hypothetical protein [Deltaproteobacteria bacterium]
MKEEKFIHLCQPDSCKSCGACCGLYNYVNSTKAALTHRLKHRTEQFRRLVKGPGDLQAFSEMIKKTEDQVKRYDVIYCCEYLGFIDQEQKKVGCLLHPLQNKGVDLRDVSFYGRELCDGHFCPSYHYISNEEKRALINVIDDWYLYGLCVTDIDLVKEYFRLISEGVHEMPSANRFKETVLKDIALKFFSLKTIWPYRSEDVNRLGKYYFDGSLYMISHIDYEAMDCEKSRFDKIFVSLTSDFKNKNEVKNGEDLIQTHINAFMDAYHNRSDIA